MSSNAIRKMYFSIDISHDQYLLYYQGAVNNIIVTSTEGARIQFPAKFMQKFVTHSGIKGHFEIQFDESNKLVSLNQID